MLSKVMWSLGGPVGVRRPSAEKAAAVMRVPTCTPATTVAWRRLGASSPVDLYVAVRTDADTGVPVGAVGPFLGLEDAQAHVTSEFDGHGLALPFVLVLRSPSLTLPFPLRGSPPRPP
jgi:hypothetical protein